MAGIKSGNPTYIHMIRRDPCVYCGAMVKQTVDHIHPKSKGGPNLWYNYAPTCTKCNSRKGSLSVLEMLMGVSQPVLDVYSLKPGELAFSESLVGLPQQWDNPVVSKRKLQRS